MRAHRLHRCGGEGDDRGPREVGGRNRGGDETVAELHCSCEHEHQVWGEFWWVRKEDEGRYEGKYEWVFFDDERASETYAEQLTHCPACTRRLEWMELKAS